MLLEKELLLCLGTSSVSAIYSLRQTDTWASFCWRRQYVLTTLLHSRGGCTILTLEDEVYILHSLHKNALCEKIWDRAIGVICNVEYVWSHCAETRTNKHGRYTFGEEIQLRLYPKREKEMSIGLVGTDSSFRVPYCMNGWWKMTQSRFIIYIRPVFWITILHISFW